MKRYIVPLLLLLVLSIPLLMAGCEDTAAVTPTPTPLYVTTDTFNTTVSQLQSAINGKANQADLTAQAGRIDGIAGKAGLSQSDVQTMLNSYAKTTDLDAAIAKYLTDHNITSSGSSGGSSGGSTTGQVTWITNPTNVQILGSAQVCYTVKVTNSTGNWVYIRPIININAATGQSPTSVNSITISIGGSSVNLATANFQFTPILPSGVTSSIVAIPTSGGNGNGEFQLAANTTADLLVCVTINAANNIIWNIGTSMNWRSL
jgi:hypothetical protein